MVDRFFFGQTRWFVPVGQEIARFDGRYLKIGVLFLIMVTGLILDYKKLG